MPRESLRITLLRLGKELTKDNLFDLKFICDDAVPTAVAERCTRAPELFSELTNREKVTEANGDYLISRLENIGRNDLATKLKEYYAYDNAENPSMPPSTQGSDVSRMATPPAGNIDNFKGSYGSHTDPGILHHSSSSPGGNGAMSLPDTAKSLPRSHSMPGHQMDQQKLPSVARSMVPKALFQGGDGMGGSSQKPTPLGKQVSSMCDSTKTSVASGNNLPDLDTLLGELSLDDETSVKKLPLPNKVMGDDDDLDVDAPMSSSALEDGGLEDVGAAPSIQREMGGARPKIYAGHEHSQQTPAVLPPLYSYQEELARASVRCENNIICAPTGSGKTLTAAHVCRQLFDASQKAKKTFKGLFIVPIRVLVSQQCEEFRRIFPDHPTVIRPIAETEMLKDVIQDSNVIVFLTAQILVNSLKEGEVNIRDLDILVLDECHHTNLEHAFNQIMRIYLKEKKVRHDGLPQILGLTASLGVGKGEAVKHYIRLCANLDCPQISHVRVNMKELIEKNPKPSTDQINSVEPRTSNTFALVIHGVMEKIEKEASLMGAPHKGTQHYKNYIVDQLEAAESGKGFENQMSASRMLRIFNDALLIYEDYRAINALEYLDDNVIPKKIPSEIETRFLSFYELQKSQLQELERQDENPMLVKLFDLLEKLLTKDKDNKDPKGLLLTRTRLGVEILYNFIRKHEQLKKLCKVDWLTGHGKSEETGMTDNRQKAAISSFKKQGGVNLLVATDVAQEGLDIPRCNFVVRYNFVSSEIGAVQSKGRARAKESECYLIVKRGSTDERREYENINKEHRMLEALHDIDLLDDKELRSSIEKKQAEIQEDLENKEKIENSRTAQMKSNSNSIRIVCKDCKSFLFLADSIRKKGSHYICIDEEFKDRVTEIRLPPSQRKSFRTDTHTGSTVCNGPYGGMCGKTIGPVLEYKASLRLKGYNIGKDNVMFQRDPREDRFEAIKKWPKVPFAIEEEKLCD